MGLLWFGGSSSAGPGFTPELAPGRGHAMIRWLLIAAVFGLTLRATWYQPGYQMVLALLGAAAAGLMIWGYERS